MRNRGVLIAIVLILSILLTHSEYYFFAIHNKQEVAIAATQNNAKPTHKKARFTWDNATIYFVMTDRFLDGNPRNNHSYGRELDRQGKPYPGYREKPGTFHGGDLQGLTKKLKEDYFTKLGVNAIWITSPLEQIHGWVGGMNFRHYAYHGYYALDFTELDQNMGSRNDLRTFIDTAHSKGIRVLFDVVMNHAGYPDMKTMDRYRFGSLRSDWKQFYYDFPDSEAHYTPYNEYVNTGDAERWQKWWGPDWIRLPEKYSGYETCSGNELTQCLADLPDFKTDSTEEVSLPNFFNVKWSKEKMATERRELQAFFKRTGKPRTPTNYLIKWLTDWVREYGIDGFRVDTAKHVQLGVWKELKKESVKALREWKAKNPSKKLDNLDFWMVGEVWGHGVGKSQYFTEGGFDALINFSFKDVPNNMQGLENVYSHYANAMNSDSTFNMLSYISSHDTSLYNRGNLLNAGTALLLAPGAVQIYYGDESGRKPDSSPWDQPTRTHMNWGSMDRTILAHWQKLGQFRNRHLSIGAGSHRKIQDSPYVFSRLYKSSGVSDQVVVAIGAEQLSVIPVGNVFEEGSFVRDFYTGRTAYVIDGRVRLQAHKNGVVLLELVAPPKPMTRVSALPGGGSFTDSSIKVTLQLKHAKTGKFTIDGSDPKVYGKPFHNGQQIVFGSRLSIGNSINLKLYGISRLGEARKTYRFTKQKKPEGLTIYFKKPSNWTAPQLYYYGAKPTSVKQITWQSAPDMKPLGNDWFVYTIPTASEAMVMFKDRRGNQIPGRNQPGFFRSTQGAFDNKWLDRVPF